MRLHAGVVRGHDGVARGQQRERQSFGVIAAITEHLPEPVLHRQNQFNAARATADDGDGQLPTLTRQLFDTG